MKKGLFKAIYYLSIAFLVLALVKADLLHVPVIVSYPQLFLSISILWMAFMLQSLMWVQILKQNLNISFVDAVISDGLFVFSKYIPGKIMIILGKSLFISEKYKHSNKIVTQRSFDLQILVIWCGLIIAGVFTVLFNLPTQMKVASIILFVLLTLFIFTNIFHTFLIFIWNKVLNKTITLPRLDFEKVFKIIPTIFLYWSILSISFWLLSNSLSNEKITIFSSLAFPVSVVTGILILIAPGGLGVREGVLVLLLTLSGYSIESATIISVSSRLWFFSGELFFFSLANILRCQSHSSNNL